jgi:cytochrome c556
MKKNLAAVAVAAAAFGGVSLDALAQAKPDVLVKQRQSAMVLQAKYLGPIGAMLKGSAPYNADIVSRNATYLENLSRMAWDGFDPSTQGEKSKAKPEIYKDAAKFKAAVEGFEADVSKLGAAARAKDEAGVRASFGAVAKSCGNCHDNFREK